MVDREKYEKVREEVFEILERELPENLPYHNRRHTEEVVERSEYVAKKEELDKKQVLLVKTAAVLHDVGHVSSYEAHEEKSIEYAEDILPELGYTPSEIKEIKQIIAATKPSREPENLKQEIIKDADTYNLGQPEFYEKSEKLRKERSKRGIEESLKEYYKLSLNLLRSHQYFTDTAIEENQERKQKHIRELEKAVDNRENLLELLDRKISERD